MKITDIDLAEDLGGGRTGMTEQFQLAACAEMLWQTKPLDWRVRALDEMGFGVGLWNWPNWDLAALEKTGADFTIMNGYIDGRLADKDGAAMLLGSVRQTAEVCKRLGVDRMNLHGTGLDDSGIPIWQHEHVTGAMWLQARDTLHRICDFGETEGLTFTLENLNLRDHPGCPFASTADVLTLVSSVDRPQLQMNLDLYHTQLGEGDLIRWCEKCLPWLGEVQIADNPGRCEPGTGEVNFRAVAQALSDLGFTGCVSLEAFAKYDEMAALDAFRAAFGSR